MLDGLVAAHTPLQFGAGYILSRLELLGQLQEHFHTCPHTPTYPHPPMQFGAGYILSRLELLGQREEAVREERARFLVLLGHLLKLYMRFGTLRGRGTEELARKAQMDVSEGVGRWAGRGCEEAWGEA